MDQSYWSVIEEMPELHQFVMEDQRRRAQEQAEQRVRQANAQRAREEQQRRDQYWQEQEQQRERERQEREWQQKIEKERAPSPTSQERRHNRALEEYAAAESAEGPWAPGRRAELRSAAGKDKCIVM